MRCLGWLAFVALAASSPAEVPGPAPRLDAWRILGPGGGGTMRRPAVSPHDPRVVVEGCDMTGAYVTRDGGNSWRMFHLGWVVDTFAFDPRDENVIYAGTGALWRSEDAGRTWSMVFPDPRRNTVEHGLGDHADVVYTTDDPLYPSGLDVNIQAIAIDAADTRRLFIASSATPPGPPGSQPTGHSMILGSEDRGWTWTRVAELATERVFAIHAEGGAVRVLAETASYEGGPGRWQRFDPPGGARIQSGSFGRDGASLLAYATTEAGVHVSENGGRSWRASNGTLGALLAGDGTEGWGPAARSKPSLGPVAASAGHGRTAYVGLRGLRDTDGARFNGIARTSDGGRSWSVVHREADRPSSNLEPSWIETRALEDGHSVWFDAPYDLAVAPGTPDVCYATDLFRTYRTLDGGRTWAQVSSARRGDDRWVSRGLDVTSTYGVHWDPFDAQRVFVSTTDIGLFRSEDGGGTWTGSTRGVPTRWRNTTYWIAFDPEVKDLAWGAFSGTHDLPRPKMWRRTDPEKFQGGVGRSTDGGRSWTPSNDGMAESAITQVLVDPASPRGRRTLYAPAFGRGVYKSVDDGRTWQLKNAGLEQRQPFAWRLTRGDDATLYLVVARRSERGRIGDADDGALYRSTDGAEHWTRMTLPPGVNGPNGLAVDPRDPRRLYLAAWGVATPGGDTGGGVFLSSDGGATWTNVLPGSQHVYDVTVDPRDPSVLYASGFDQAAYRSADRGATWSRLRGFNFKWAHRVVPDAVDPGKVYVTTFGGSVWHGPATGDPGAPEDRLPPPASAWPGRVTDPKALSRVEQLVEANVIGTHAFQVRLARRSGRGDPACYASGLSDAALEALETHQAALLATDPAVAKAWASGEPSAFEPARDLEPLLDAGLPLSPTLPVNVFAEYLSGEAPGRARAHLRAHARHRQPVPDQPGGGARRRPVAGAVPLLHRPGAAGVRGSAAPARPRRRLPRGGTEAGGKELRVTGGDERRGVADRGAEDLELGREEPAPARRPRAGRRAAAGAGGGRPGAAHPGAAPAAGGRDRPFLHHGPALGVALCFRAHRHRPPRAREPGRRGPPVPGRRPHRDARLRPLLPGRGGLEARRGAAGGDEPHRRGPGQAGPPREGAQGRGGEGLRLRRRARSRLRRSGAAAAGARGRGAGGRRDRGGGPAARERTRPRSLREPGRSAHDGAVSPVDGP
jgi:hypothetical protein